MRQAALRRLGSDGVTAASTAASAAAAAAASTSTAASGEAVAATTIQHLACGPSAFRHATTAAAARGEEDDRPSTSPRGSGSGGGGAGGGPAPSWPGKRLRRGPARGDDVLRSLQAAPSLLDLEDLLESQLRSLTYIHLGAAAMRAAKLAGRAGWGREAAAAGGGGGEDARAARQLQRLMKQLEGLYERAMPMLPAR